VNGAVKRLLQQSESGGVVVEARADHRSDESFRPLLPVAGWIGDRAVSASCFHYYTAGFGLLQESFTRGIHIACVLGPDLSGLFLDQKAIQRRPRRAFWRPLGISVIDWLCCIAAVVTSLYVPWVFHDLAFRVGNPDPIDWMRAP